MAGGPLDPGKPKSLKILLPSAAPSSTAGGVPSSTDNGTNPEGYETTAFRFVTDAYEIGSSAGGFGPLPGELARNAGAAITESADFAPPPLSAEQILAADVAKSAGGEAISYASVPYL
jgi:hypothetical protein